LQQIVVSFSGIVFPAGATRFAFSSAKARAQTIAPSGLFEKLSAFLKTLELCDYSNRKPANLSLHNLVIPRNEESLHETNIVEIPPSSE